jgi:large subunit ribosomal protein L21
MYAVIRTGGKQYRVAPGDTLRIEKSEHDGTLEFSDVLAVSGDEGKFEQELGGAKVLAEVVGEGRGDKILVFHYKRKKQYKKLQGHRQPFTSVRITEIAFDGQKFTAPSLAKKEPKAKKEAPAAGEEKTAAKSAKPKAKKKASAPKKSAAKKSTGKKK